VPIGT